MLRVSKISKVRQKKDHMGGKKKHSVLVSSLVSMPPLPRSSSVELLAASAAIPSILASSVADSTGNNYAGAWFRFSSWCRENGRSFLPASVDTVSLYLTVISLRSKSISPAYSARSAINYYHQLRDPSVLSPTEHLCISQLIAGLHQTLQNLQRKKNQSLQK